MPALNDAEKRLASYPFDDLIHSKNSSQSWEIDAHWALYCENYLEGFHVPYVHRGLAKEIDVNTYKTILLENAVLQIAEGDKSYDVFKNIDTTDQNLYGLYYWIFPNLMLNFYSWGLSINIIEPISPSKTRIRFLSYPIKNNEQPLDGDDTLSKVEKEDQNVVLGVQKGIRSRFYSSGRYSPKHEKGIHHFHLLLDKYLT
jgi:choline monooxygenase